MLRKIISGGQTGADQGGLMAADGFKWIKTGGYIVKGYRTEDGPAPELSRFGLIELDAIDYPKRTFANVRESDGTLCFATVWGSAGMRCTFNAIRKYNKPHFRIDPSDSTPVGEVIDWIVANNIEVLNIAGNSESKSPGLQQFTTVYIIKLLTMIEGMHKDTAP